MAQGYLKSEFDEGKLLKNGTDKESNEKIPHTHRTNYVHMNRKINQTNGMLIDRLIA